jgi:lipopolysaccharide/colanic/teichoic acid biosynthesis glycosyltransferase
MRRAFEFVCAAAGLLLLSPLFALLAAAIKLEDGGPVFYAQARVGRDFCLFRLLKFRSMTPDAERRGLSITTARDPRVTRVGVHLRRYKLDEFPQLWNVLRGDMGLVGVRPEVERYVSMFRSQFAEILRQRPGITDPASLTFRNEWKLLADADVEGVYIGQILPRKLELSLEYARRRTFSSDLAVILRTLAAVLLPAWPRQAERSVPPVPPTDPPGATANKRSRQ